MKKVLIIDNSLDITGAFKAILANAIDLKENFEFHFLIPKQSINKDHIESLGFRCVQLSILEISKRPWSNLLYFPLLLINSIKVTRYANQNSIEIVHVNDIYNMIGLLAKAWRKLKVITHIRRMPESFPLFIYKMWVVLHEKFSDSIIPVSMANARIFESPKSIQVIYDKLPGKEELPDYTCRDNKLIKILYLANYNRGKGHDHAVKVVSRLFKNGVTNFQMNFFGGDFGLQKNKDFKNELVKEVRDFELSANIFFHDKTDKVEKVMKDHDIVLNFSDSESFSNVSLEALFYGVPLVATDVGGTSEMFDTNQSGLLVEKGNIDDMFEALYELVYSYSLRKQLSKQSKVTVRNRFGIKNTSYKLREIYNGV